MWPVIFFSSVVQLGLFVITGRNEVVAKVMFLQVCVCPQGGGCLPQCMLECQTPQDKADPPGPGRPPPQDQTDIPPDQAPPHHPRRKQTPAYGLRAAGTHPTGMHSCLTIIFDNYWIRSRECHYQ